MLVKVIEVPDPPVPAVSSNNAPFKVVVIALETEPPHVERPQPKPGSCSAGPTG